MQVERYNQLDASFLTIKIYFFNFSLIAITVLGPYCYGKENIIIREGGPRS